MLSLNATIGKYLKAENSYLHSELRQAQTVDNIHTENHNWQFVLLQNHQV